MAAPVPSFFKIRLVALILGFFLLFFFIGLVRWCFAYTDVFSVPVGNDCWYIRKISSGYLYNAPSTALAYSDVRMDSGGFELLDKMSAIAGYRHSQVWQIRYKNNGVWSSNYTLYTDKMFPSVYSEILADWHYKTVDDLQCAEAPSCASLEAEFLAGCSLGSATNMECVEGSGVVTGNCDTCETISSTALQLLEDVWGDANCDGGSKYVTNYNCETGVGECEETTCSNLLMDCLYRCNSQVQEGFICTDLPEGGVIVDSPCLCVNEIITSGQVTDLPIYDYNELTGELNLDGQSLDDNSTTADQAVVQNTAAISDNIAKQTQTINNSVSNVSNTINQTSNVLNETVNTVDNSVNQVNTSIQNLGEKLDEIFPTDTGTYTGENLTNDFELSDNATGQFGSRFTTFVDGIKNTPLFSLPDQVLFNIPNSTESIYTVDMGSYGTMDVDFANYATPLLILRAGFLLCFSFAALRIVVSKK